MSQAGRKKMYREVNQLNRSQKFIPKTLLDMMISVLEEVDKVPNWSSYENEFLNKDYGSFFNKMIKKNTSFKDVCDKINWVEKSLSEGQFYITVLIVSLYCRYYQTVAVHIARNIDAKKDILDQLNFDSKYLNKVSKLGNYVDMPMQDFQALTFDTKQLAYLKTAAIKICRLAGGIDE